MEDFESTITKIEKRRKDKSTTATVDKVLDPKTMHILKQLENRGKLTDLSGSISTGKEANIYTAKCSTSLISKFIQKEMPETDKIVPVVLKIYKTSTMMFKDRTRYIIDEKRFKNFCTSNSRKLIKLWSEKEVRNLKRLGKSGIPCPVPLYLKRSILIMSMIGDSSPAPKLKDANISADEWDGVYQQCIKLIKDMYQKARLIHADFSEYNLVYKDGLVYVIDVSQSMDIHQENSNTFLMMDLCNCNEFFAKKNVSVRSEVELFEEITKLRIPEYLKVDGKLNKECFIPSRIIEVANKEDIGLFIDDYKGIVDEIQNIDLNSNHNSGNEENEYEEENEECFDDEENEYEEEENKDECFNEEENEECFDDEENEYEEENEEYSNEEDAELDVELNDISNENVSNESVSNEDIPLNNIKSEDCTASFTLKTYADLTQDSINLYVRRLRLKNPEISKEEEKAINKARKAIIKEMNRERRIKRVQRKEEYKSKNQKRKKNYFNK